MKSVEELQGSLYQAAKADKSRRFYSLKDKLCRMDLLKEALKRVMENHGVSGVDKQTIENLKEIGEEQFLTGLRYELVTETYRVQDVKRVFIPKRSGGTRPLGIPTVKDRIVQEAVKLVIEPIFEADFQEFSYGYRPARSAKQASCAVYKWLNFGLTNIVDVDIKGFFDHVNHERLLSFVGERIADGYVLKLIKEWLRAGVAFEDAVTYPDEGTPQGGVISPLLANIYLDMLDRRWVELGMNRRRAENAQMVRYADDIVVLTGGEDVKLIWDVLEWLLSELDLEISMEKSRITKAEDGFDFLSFHFVRRRNWRGKVVTAFFPCKGAVARFKEKVRALTSKSVAGLKDEEKLVLQLNRLIFGWSNYFNHSNANKVYRGLQKFIEWRFRKFLCFKHQCNRWAVKYGGIAVGDMLGLAKLYGRISYIRT